MNIEIHPKIKHTARIGLWAIASMLLGLVLASLAFKVSGYQRIKQDGNISEKTETISKEEKPKQEFFYFIKDPSLKPNVKAGSFLVGDLDTGEIILEKNSDQKMPIASVSKLFTATVSTENQDQDAMTKISSLALKTLGQNGDLHVNEKIKVGDLIYPLLLESSNGAAEVIAEFSGRTKFLDMMNQKVKDLGLFQTSFKDPSGLSEQNISTAKDLFMFSKYLKYNKEDLLKITKERSQAGVKHTWFNNSQFLGMDGYLGGKRGYTDKAMQTAVSIFSIPLGQKDSKNISVVLLHSPDRYKDMQNVLKFLKKNVYYGREEDAELAWVKEKEFAISDADNSYVMLDFGGDIMLDRGVRNSVNRNFESDYSTLFDNLGILEKADITFANLEGPASDQGNDKQNLYSFRMDPSVIPALSGAGFNVLSVANNHVGDWGRDAYIDTLSRLKENEILYTGGGLNTAEAEAPVIVEKNGMKIGYLAFSDVGPNWMEATNENAGLLLANNPRFDEIISNASKKVDALVVSFHFGEEYKTTHNQRQEDLAHRAVDDGAKIIIGSHPHVIQDTEVYKNSFIAYSLGNFIFDQPFSENTMKGLLLEIKLHKDGTMETTKNIVKLNSAFQPDKILYGKEEKVKFQKAEKI